MANDERTQNDDRMARRRLAWGTGDTSDLGMTSVARHRERGLMQAVVGLPENDANNAPTGILACDHG
ncbi:MULTISPECIES: hypothetical protein [unclassified Bradyrhizobium]|uniref:hypothetical protein n=1 Tax=unclassified Bradyrhizobium TaxID=2631580 RepID=UPI0028E3544C|nr:MULTISPECIES: hypothetical protein [unclassified Bradyrhizobium]